MPTDLRFLVREALGWALWPLLAPLTSHYIGGRTGLILMLHHIGEPVLRGAEDYLFLSREEMGRILDFVKAELSPLAPCDFLTRLAAGTLPPRATMLTFDDGTYDQVALAVPELTRRGLNACVFVCPGLMEAGLSIPSLELATLCQHAQPGTYRLGSDIDLHGQAEAGLPLGRAEGVARSREISLTIRDQRSRVKAFWALLPLLMRCPSRVRSMFLADLRSRLRVPPEIRCPYRLATWEELSRLVDSGMYVGNHTLFHSTVDADGIEQFAADVNAAFEALEQHLSVPQRIFCYPYGRAADATVPTAQVLRTQQVEYGLVVQGGLARPDRTGLLALHREAVSCNVRVAKLSVLLAGLR